ncbi:MAG: hypothetical protein JW969_03325 [Spirochaetales bacterium]|nr:hypothetical protein [Spirochaetales bacterium]
MENFDKLSDVELSEKQLQDVNGGLVYVLYSIGHPIALIADAVIEWLTK